MYAEREDQDNFYCSSGNSDMLAKIRLVIN
jgi:hypothetical protein